MRSVFLALAACSLLACSSAPSTNRLERIACVSCNTAPSSAPPVITFVLVPSSIKTTADGTYDLGVTLSFTDEDDGPHSVRIETASFTLEAPLPVGAPNALVSTGLSLPDGAPKGTLDFSLTVVSSSGVESAPYKDSVFLL
jgi:hypothetical protein